MSFRSALFKFVAETIFGVLWPKRMAEDRRRRQSLKGILLTTLTKGLIPYLVRRTGTSYAPVVVAGGGGE
jgi:hypothetical protein